MNQGEKKIQYTAQQNGPEKEKKYLSILNNIHNGCIQTDLAGNYIFLNDAVFHIFGYSRREMMGMNYRHYIDKKNADKVFKAYNKVFNTGEPCKGFSWEFTRKDGAKRWLETSISLHKDSSGRPIGFIAIVKDVTERKQIEEKYRNIFENAQEGIYQSTPDGRFILANQSMARILGYDSPEELVSSVTDIACQIYVYPEERNKNIKMMVQEEFAENNEVQFYRKDGSIIWVNRTIQAVSDENGKVRYYEGLVTDITERKKSVERLRSALKSTIQAIASMVEKRDPYTAGHQRRVAELAGAIATDMDLSNDQIEGVRMAAIIHDIGKIAVPTEILSKPTKLTVLEFNLIKIHSQAGYEILKDIEFPWPVARMVIEHHERINGSGYPNGLTGDELLLEARILAVADVVEAMISHRPYRASLGVEAALGEIEKNKGILYDIAVTDVCLKLFREKSYKPI